MDEEFIERLKKLARQGCWQDRFDDDANDSCVYDWCGGNVDDAYQGGFDAGEICMARDVLSALKIDWIN